VTFKKVLNNLQPGEYVIRVKAVGASLLDSEWSAIFTVIVTGDTTPPPVPSAPTVSQSLAGINISWIDPSYTLPVDFAGVEVYYSVDSYTTPIGFITVKGGVQPFTTQEYSTSYRFKFKAVDRSGNKSAFSAESNAISPAKLVESDVTAGILDFDEIPYKDNGNFISDGSFETTSRQDVLTNINTALKISFGTSGAFLGSGSLNILSGGVNQDIYLMGNPAALDFVNQYPLIVNPSDVYLGRLAVKNTSGSTATVSLKMRIYKTDLTTTDLTLVTQSVTSSSSWQALITNTAQSNRVIPSNGYAAQILVVSTQPVSIDTTEVRQVIGTALIQDAAITNAQIQDATIQSAKIATLAAGKITSDSITSAELQISSTGKLYAGTSPSIGERLLFDVNGLRAFNSSNVNTVNISSNGSASLTGTLTATGGTFTGFMTAGQVRIGAGIVSGRDGISFNNNNDFIYDNGQFRLGNGKIVFNPSTGVLTIDANGTFSGSLSSGISISSPVISGGSITGSTLNIGSGTFQVNSSGSLTATSATLTGRITLPSSSDTIRFLSGGSTVGTIDNYSASGINIYFGTTGAQGALDVTSAEAALRYGGSSYVQATSSGIFTGGDTNLGQRVFAPNILTTSNAANMRHGNLGELLRVTSSSARYKENIQNINIISSLNANNLLSLPVRSFTYKEQYLLDNDDRFGQVVPGFIAEEVNEYYPIAVDYVDGEINSWNERFIIPGMLSLIQDMNQEITELKTRLDALEQ
jgi:hypothetical protein